MDRFRLISKPEQEAHFYEPIAFHTEDYSREVMEEDKNFQVTQKVLNQPLINIPKSSSTTLN